MTSDDLPPLYRPKATAEPRLAGCEGPSTSWDPFFADYMTLADIYHYPTQHFRFHQRQLTLSPPHG